MHSAHSKEKRFWDLGGIKISSQKIPQKTITFINYYINSFLFFAFIQVLFYAILKFKF